MDYKDVINEKKVKLTLLLIQHAGDAISKEALVSAALPDSC